jgi:hypothetical protein
VFAGSPGAFAGSPSAFHFAYLAFQLETRVPRAERSNKPAFASERYERSGTELAFLLATRGCGRITRKKRMAHDHVSKKETQTTAEKDLAGIVIEDGISKLGLGKCGTMLNTIQHVARTKKQTSRAVLSEAQIESEVEKALGFFDLASKKEGEPGAAKVGLRETRARLREIVAGVGLARTSLIEVGRFHGVDVSVLTGFVLRGTTSELKSAVIGLATCVEGMAAKLGDGASVTEPLSVISAAAKEIGALAASLEIGRDGVTGPDDVRRKAHRACEQIVKQLVHAMRVGYWNDAGVLAKLKLGTGGGGKRSKTNTTAEQPAMASIAPPKV